MEKQPNIDPEDKPSLMTIPAQSTISGTTIDSPRRLFRKGDRVGYVGPSNGSSTANFPVSSHHGSSGSKGPSIGTKGRVILLLDENPNKVGVRFDKPVYGGNNMVDFCEDGYGYFCNAANEYLMQCWSFVWSILLVRMGKRQCLIPLLMF